MNGSLVSKRHFLALSLCLAVGIAGSARADEPAIPAERELNHSCLPQLFEASNLTTPERFKALVGKVETDGEGVVTVRWFDHQGTGTDRDDWWPASTVKLYAAIAALERLGQLGFGPNATLEFQDEDAEAPFRARMDVLVRQSIVASHNRAFDRLVEFVGFDALHRRFFTRRNGFSNTVMLRAYGGRNRHPETGHSENRRSPAITLSRGHKHRELPARTGRARVTCPDQGNCTTLRELAEAMYRVMTHEQLPETGRFRLGTRELALLRSALEAERREHGRLLVEAITASFGASRPVRVFHKPGYAYRWSSDVMWIEEPGTDHRWLVAAAAYPGRRVLDPALRTLSRILAGGGLRSCLPTESSEDAP